jgi:hypothetical protein
MSSMRNLVIAITGFLLGGALVTGAALAFTPSQTVTVKQTPIVSAMPMSGATMMSSAATAPGSQRLFIQHVMRGCHIWSNGKTQATTMRLALRTGGRLSILDQDVDAHQLMQLSGPTRLHLGGPMAMNHATLVVFPKKGVYQLRTKTVDMPGMSTMDVKTIGPDNTLRLFVTVR